MSKKQQRIDPKQRELEFKFNRAEQVEQICRLKEEILSSPATTQKPTASWAGFADLVDAYLPIAIDWVDTYDEIYWMRPNGLQSIDDGFRSVDQDFQEEIDRIFAKWFRIYNIPASRCCFGGVKR